MQRRKHQVAGFGRGQCQADGFDVSHLTHQDNIRILTQCGSQRLVKAMCIPVEFALINNAFLTPVNKLDGVFNGQNMTFDLVIQMVNQRGQRR